MGSMKTEKQQKKETKQRQLLTPEKNSLQEERQE